jgi:FkbM family methyltransferase
MTAIIRTLKFIVQHPLNRGRLWFALKNYFRWQIGSRLVPGPVAVTFVGDTRLLVKSGMAGATQNIYCGLQEFEDMAFVLHALRPGDLLVDAGANIGSYTILAAGACGAYVTAVEPVPTTFAHLLDNICLNDVKPLVTPLNIGLGSAAGQLHFSQDLDTVNHVLEVEESMLAPGITVRVDTLDAILEGQGPTIIKIDVEGYETEVLKGANATLASDKLLAVVMELNGSGNRYGFDDAKLHLEMLKHRFVPCTYDPWKRLLTPLNGKNAEGNTLYVRNSDNLTARLTSAPRCVIHGTRV